VTEVEDATRHVLEWIAESEGVKREEMAFDVTGGKTLMSIGAFLAADRMGVDVQYISSAFDKDTNKWVPGTTDALMQKRPTR